MTTNFNKLLVLVLVVSFCFCIFSLKPTQTTEAYLGISHKSQAPRKEFRQHHVAGLTLLARLLVAEAVRRATVVEVSFVQTAGDSQEAHSHTSQHESLALAFQSRIKRF